MMRCWRGIVLYVVVLVVVIVSSRQGLAVESAVKDEIPNVVVIMISGVSNSETVNDEKNLYIPNLREKVFPEGTFFSDLEDLNYQFHMPALRSIITGLNYNEYANEKPIKRPSLFQYLIMQHGFANNRAWMIGHWDENDCEVDYGRCGWGTFPRKFSSFNFILNDDLKAIADDRDWAFEKKFRGMMKHNFIGWTNWDSEENAQQHIIRKVMDEYKPKLMVCVMNGVEIAHYDTYGRYVMALKRTDENIYEIFNRIRTDKFYKDNTYFFITVDHERNEYYMLHHENPYDNPSHVWMYCYGPGIKKGVVVDRTIHHRDMFVTIANILKLKTYQAQKTKGRLLPECLPDENNMNT